MRWRSPSPEATRAAGRALAAAIDPFGLVIALVGPLGAGKTVFVQGLAEGLGHAGCVASPTFVIASEYPAAPDGARALVHVDLYRVESEAELEAAGFLDLLGPGAAVAVEWGERFPDALPADRLEIRLGRGASGAAAAAPLERELEVEARGPRAAATLARWRAALAGAATSESEGSEKARCP